MPRRRWRFGGPWDYYRFPAPSRPIAVRGGIRAQSKRGRFAESWWADRWIAVLESFEIGARRGRGRAYARRGQVLSIDVGKGIVRARVQGSRPTPYHVSVKVKPLTPAQWTRVARALASEAGFAARLLAGEMPRDIEQVFARAGVSLFPGTAHDLATACSCPDWSNPCKHIAAVYYLLGEEFDRDPFLLFRMRGLTRDELLDLLGARAAAAPAAPERPGDARPRGRAMASRERRHRLDPSRFWVEASVPVDVLGDVAPPPAHASLLRRLGRFPFWRGETAIVDTLEPSYRNASRAALELFAGERGPGGRPRPARR